MAVSNFKQVIQDLVIPEFRTLQVEIRRLDEKIDSGLKRLDEKIDSFREEFRSEIKRIDQGTDGLERTIISIKEEFRLAIDIHERLAAVEARVGH